MADENKAISTLASQAGVTDDRASALVTALLTVVRDETLAMLAGETALPSSILDARVDRLRRLIAAAKDEPLPSSYEVAALFAIPETQARSALRSLRARHPDVVDGPMRTLVTKAAHGTGGTEEAPTERFTFVEIPTLDYAADMLRRSGLTRGLKVDRAGGWVEVASGARDRQQRDVFTVLGVTTAK